MPSGLPPWPRSDVKQPLESPPLPLLLPAWDLNPALYHRLCRHLGLTGRDDLQAKVARHLQLRAPVRPACEGFALWLADLDPGTRALGFLDVWTRLLWPDHPWRQRLNAVVAVHECDGPAYREMMAAPDHRALAWLQLLGVGLTFSWRLAAGTVWLAFQGVRYALGGGGMRREQAYFAGRTVLVTGAARGLGLALAARLLQMDARVVVVARPGATLDRLAAQAREAGWDSRLRLLSADLAQPGALAQALARSADDWPLDAAILNAGVKEDAPLPDGLEALRRTFEVNVFATLATTATVLPALLASGRGHLVFISSQGRWHGMARSGAYNASKAAVSLLAESLLMDLGEEGRRRVKVTTVEPGLLRTAMIQPGSLQDRLAVDVAPAARRILQSVARGRATCRFPLGFTLLTGVIALLPRDVRVRVLGGIKPPPPS